MIKMSLAAETISYDRLFILFYFFFKGGGEFFTKYQHSLLH